MAKRKKVEGISGTRAVSTPGARIVDTYAAPTQSKLGDLSSALTQFNPKLEKYSANENQRKNEQDTALMRGTVAQYRLEHGEKSMESVRAGIIPAFNSLIAENQFKQNMGVKDGQESWNTFLNETLLPNGQYSEDKGLRDAAIDLYFEEQTKKNAGLPFYSAGALVAGQTAAKEYKHNADAAQIALMKDTATKTTDLTIGSIINDSTLSILGIREKITEQERIETSGGNPNNKPTILNNIVTSTLNTLENMSDQDSQKAIEMFGTQNDDGSFSDGVFNDMYGEAKFWTPERILEVNKKRDELIASSIKKNKANDTANIARAKTQDNDLQNEWHKAIYEATQKGKAYINPMLWIRKNHGELLKDQNWLNNGGIATIMDYANKTNDMPSVDSEESVINMTAMDEIISGISILGNNEALNAQNPFQAKIIDYLAEKFPDGNINMNSRNIAEMSRLIPMNPREREVFVKNAQKTMQAANKIKITHLDSAQRRNITQRIKDRQKGFNTKMTDLFANLDSDPLGIEANILDLYDTLVYNGYLDLWRMNDGPPSGDDLAKLYDRAGGAALNELKEYVDYAKATNAKGITQEDADAIERPNENNLVTTIRLGESMLAEMDEAFLKGANFDNLGLVAGEEQTVRRVEAKDVKTGEGHFYSDSGKWFELILPNN